MAQLVDDAGAGRPNSAYLLVPLGDDGCPSARSAWIERVSDGDGRVDERELAPGAWRAWFAPTYCAPVVRDLQLVAGDNDLGFVRFPTVFEAGAVRVELASNVSWAPLGGILSLRSLDGRTVERWNPIGEGPWAQRFGTDRGGRSFQFEHVPAGEYELRLHVDHGQRFERHATRVHVPGDPVVFRRLDEIARLPVFARVSQARSGQPILDVTVIAYDALNLCATEYLGGWGEQITVVQEGDERRWFALAKDSSCIEFARHATQPVEGAVTLEGQLESGFSAFLIARDGDALLRTPGVVSESALRRDRAPGLAGVAILADGVVVARTDADGLALLNLPNAPRAWSAEMPGRCAVDSENLRDGRIVYSQSPLQFWLATR